MPPPAALTFAQVYQKACAMARVSSADAAVAAMAQEFVNSYYEELVNLCPEAPWMRRDYRFPTYPAMAGVKAIWLNGSTTLLLDITEKLTVAQIVAYANGRVSNPVDSDSYLISNINVDGITITLDKEYQGTSTAVTVPATYDGWELVLDLYAFPDDYGGFIILKAPVGPPLLTPRNQIEHSELHYFSTDSGTPEEVIIVYSAAGVASMLLSPAPADAHVYTLTYTKLITRLVAGSAFLVPNEGIQAIMYKTAGDLATTLREDTQLGGTLNAIGQGKWDKLVNKYAPERARPRFKLPTDLRVFQPRTGMQGCGSHVDGDWWARQG